jgi:hypothetical protein
MNETNSSWLTNNPCSITTTGITTGTSTIAGGYPGTSINTIADGYSGLTLSGNSTINYLTNQNSNRMAPRQVHVAVFTIKRDKDTNEINSTKFVKELWIEQKNGTSIDLLVAKQLDKDFDPETTIIKVLSTLIF